MNKINYEFLIFCGMKLAVFVILLIFSEDFCAKKKTEVKQKKSFLKLPRKDEWSVEIGFSLFIAFLLFFSLVN
jgi:hypothetical protein